MVPRDQSVAVQGAVPPLYRAVAYLADRHRAEPRWHVPEAPAEEHLAAVEQQVCYEGLQPAVVVGGQVVGGQVYTLAVERRPTQSDFRPPVFAESCVVASIRSEQEVH